MAKFGWISGIVVVAGAITLLAMKDFIVPKVWNYKITVEIETPQGVKTGSAVRQVRARRELAGYLGAGEVIYEVIGEAVVVDMGERKPPLFALIEEAVYVEMEDAFNRENRSNIENLIFFSELPSGSTGLLESYQPKMVTFLDRNDAKSITLVYERKTLLNATRSEDRFTEIYGKGFALKSVFIEITRERVTRRILSMVPWLSDFSGHRGFLGGEQKPPFKDITKTYVTLSDFIRGE